jgi:hypothetical protein
MCEVVIELLGKMYRISFNQVVLVPNVAISITGHRTGSSARMRAEVPILIVVHCIEYHEVLVA